MVLSSPPKCLAELPQYLLRSSLHCPPPVTLFSVDAWLQPVGAAPLIFLLRNLQRQIKSGFTCVIFNSCPSPSWAPHYSPVFCYLFSLFPQTHYMTGVTQAQKRLWAIDVMVQRSPGEGGDAVFAGSRCIRWQRVSKIALSLMATLTKASGPTLLICFPKGQGVPFQSALTFFLLSFWLMRFNCVKGERELLVQDFIPEFMWFVCSH